MKAKTLATCLTLAILALPLAAAQSGYFASKADERAGHLTPGNPPAGPTLRVGGNTCAAALAIANPGAATFTDSGTTVGADNTVQSVRAGCSDYTTTAGPDVIYQFDLGPVAARGTPLTITVTPTLASFDPAIYTLSTAAPGCPAGTGATLVANCVNGADSGLANAPETITDAETDAMAAGHYFLFVDSFYAAGASCPQGGLCGDGTYNLSFGTGPFPVELMNFQID
ncbi:MAG TPA: hypothetical protein VN783_16865 [Thermoanaerobaculia bacterium]|nr:hypothetical protein [Thermoanaerobaculia bacterium]